MIDDYKKYLTFSGHNPQTNIVTHFIFNEPTPSRKNILDFDGSQWWYSEDAGLTWQPITQRIVDLLLRFNAVDMIMDRI